MKRYEYKFNGKVVAMVDVSPINSKVAFFRVVGDPTVTRCNEQDAKALAKAFIQQLKGVTPSPELN